MILLKQNSVFNLRERFLISYCHRGTIHFEEFDVQYCEGPRDL
jgi:hypothetical protein